jgi:hypothetical protein
MPKALMPSSVFAVAFSAATVFAPHAARALHTCDPVTDPGWNVVASEETIRETDSAPFPEGDTGNWFVTRTTVYLPFCNYYNELGIYSMRSYSLAAQSREEPVQICKATRGSAVAVAPYTGPCPAR